MYLIFLDKSAYSMPGVVVPGRITVGVLGEVAGRRVRAPAGALRARARRRVVEAQRAASAAAAAPCHLLAGNMHYVS